MYLMDNIQVTLDSPTICGPFVWETYQFVEDSSLDDSLLVKDNTRHSLSESPLVENFTNPSAASYVAINSYIIPF